MSTTTPTAPPDDLGSHGRKLWVDVVGQVAEDGNELDLREQRILRDACRTADDLAVLEAALADATTVVIGSTGQPVPNRLFDEARKARALIATLLRQIELVAPQSQGGRGSATTSEKARAAAAVRWSSPRLAGG